MREGTAEMAGGTSVQFSPSAGGGLQAGKQSIREDCSAGASPCGCDRRQEERGQAPPAPGAEAQWRAALHTIHLERGDSGRRRNGSGGRDTLSNPPLTSGTINIPVTFPGERDWAIAPLPKPFRIVA